MVARFVRLAETGELARRVEVAYERLAACDLCPRECGIDRTAGEIGYCKGGYRAKVFSHTAHMGEEPPISGTSGSGTIFFSHCTMSCVYCQNYRMSQHREGNEVGPAEIAQMMVRLSDHECHNLNLVTPTHYLPMILKALLLAHAAGVVTPVVWNTSGYDSLKTLRLLDGVVDIYLADLRYSSGAAAARFSDAPDYVEVARRALLEMDRQVGALEVGADGVAERGLIVRHLILPHDISGTDHAMSFVARELSPGTYISLMAQYYPVYRSHDFPELARRITREEYGCARKSLADAGVVNGWIQNWFGSDGTPSIAGHKLRPDEDC